MSHSRQDYFLRNSIASKLIRNNHAGPALAGLQQLTEEPYSSKTITFRLHQNVDDGALLIDGTPEIMLHAVDAQKHLVQMPSVARLWSPSAQLVSKAPAEL